MSNTQIVDSLQHYNLKARTRKNVDWDALSTLNTPDTVLILSWMLEGYIGHVSVLEKVTKTHIFLAEPTTGTSMKIEKIKFLRMWWDYEAQGRDIWYPETKADIQLRCAIMVSK